MEIPTKLTGVKPEITVLLSDKFGELYKPFHCVVCGNIVFEYNEEEIRTILPSGRPMIGKPGKIYTCMGVLRLHNNYEIYDILYQVMEATFNMNDLSDVRTTMQYLSETAKLKVNSRCKARYFVS